MIKVAINGFGRIGRTFFKQALERPEVEITAVNDLTDEENLAYLLRYDTVYGKYDKEVRDLKEKGKKYLVVEGKKILSLSEKDPKNLPWRKLGIDVVVESTGVFNSADKAAFHLKAGAKRVVISAPAKGDVEHVLCGANEDRLSSPSLGEITSNASCTTNAVVPVAAVLMKNPGVKKAMLNTIHGYTVSQALVDSPSPKDFRKGRAAAQNIIPSHTGAAEAAAKSLPYYEKIFDAIALRVPVISGSIIDFTFVSKKKTSAKEINNILRKAAKSDTWKGTLKVSEEPLVSSDIIGDPSASIIDLSFTRVVDGDLVKVLSWYDNEWGYSHTLLEHVISVGKLIKK
ncbi:MAG: type I glyceraldehyde-3-phosphate dehydrogenase [Parcubacteria group bacterium]|nr:type I glyceraldehyde-3-phosphate dehydrogenase [Parcubacteria group bacterium]|tara:strand:+ start:2001 stop:3029 length:1029 start_codon:yes stop_codon:yes gene_type:complete